MNYSVKFRPEVEDDALSAYHWCEDKSTGLGEEFLRIFYANALELVRNKQSMSYNSIRFEGANILVKG